MVDRTNKGSKIKGRDLGGYIDDSLKFSDEHEVCAGERTRVERQTGLGLNFSPGTY